MWGFLKMQTVEVSSIVIIEMTVDENKKVFVY